MVGAAMWKLLLIPLFLYGAILLALFALQGRILFPAAAIGRSGPPPPGAAELIIAAGGETLHGLHIPPAQPAARNAPVILGFGGNAWDAGDAAAYLHQILPEHDIIVFHYRGYGPSSGRPSAQALTADSLLVHDEATRLFPGRPIVAVGFSIGTGVAAYLASRRALGGVVLVTPFDSLRRVAADHYPWLPVAWLFRNEMAAASWLEGREVPAAILAAGGDTVIPAARTAALRGRLRDLVLDRTFRGAGHNDIYQRPDFQQALRAAVTKVGTSGAKAPR